MSNERRGTWQADGGTKRETLCPCCQAPMMRAMRPIPGNETRARAEDRCTRCDYVELPFPPKK